MSTTPSALRNPERFAIGMDIPSRGTPSSEAAETRKGSAARTKVGEKYISVRSEFAGYPGSEGAEKADVEGSTFVLHFIHTKVCKDYTSELRVVGYECW
jgi:hypothetical protein